MLLDALDANDAGAAGGGAADVDVEWSWRQSAAPRLNMGRPGGQSSGILGMSQDAHALRTQRPAGLSVRKAQTDGHSGASLAASS